VKHVSEFLYRSTIPDILWEVLPILIVSMDTGVIKAATQPAEFVFGYSVFGELVGKSVDELVPLPVREAHGRHREEYQAHPKHRPMGQVGPVQGLRKDGTTVMLEIQLVPALIEGARCIICVIGDMSHRQGLTSVVTGGGHG
jgi:PAS domain S-box-containing protein